MSEQPKALALADDLEFHGRYGAETEEGAARRRVKRNAESAAELRRQHAEIERLREALKPFADFAEHYPKDRSRGNRASSGDTFYAVCSGGLPDAAIMVDDFHAALAALERKP